MFYCLRQRILHLHERLVLHSWFDTKNVLYYVRLNNIVLLDYILAEVSPAEWFDVLFVLMLKSLRYSLFVFDQLACLCQQGDIEKNYNPIWILPQNLRSVFLTLLHRCHSSCFESMPAKYHVINSVNRQSTQHL